MTCPCCASKVGAHRAQEIGDLVEKVHAEGGSAALVTLTVRHRAGQRLAPLWDAITYAWSRVTSGAKYADELQRFGVSGWVAVVEATHGDAGWHPHRHILVLFDGPVSQEMTEALADRWWLRWERALNRRGFDAVADKGGLDVRRVADGSGSLGVYLSKIAHEVSGAPTKRGRGTSRTHWQILNDFLATGSADDYDLWVEYEQTAQRRRTLTWAKGTRERYGLSRERSAKEITEDDAGGDDVLALPNESWRQVRDRSELLLTAAERDGITGAMAWLTERGITFTRVKGKPHDRDAESARADYLRRDARSRWSRVPRAYRPGGTACMA
ncbi:protein rep [Pseudonocardia sp. NPDC046786]|uniref:protein rep n=1 Tax=Pseudonocardia sp. NPDC046786 TaxID=3155471 RepID=UPI0033D23231